MASVSAAEYRRFCRDYIEEALLRPPMFFSSLREMEMQMHGHFAAFSQLDVITSHDSTFNSSFGNWLYQEYQASCASGWARGIDQLVGTEGDDPETIFDRLVRVFLAEWVEGGDSYRRDYLRR